ADSLLRKPNCAWANVTMLDTVRNVLRRTFGHADFRGLQAGVIGELAPQTLRCRSWQPPIGKVRLRDLVEKSLPDLDHSISSHSSGVPLDAGRFAQRLHHGRVPRYAFGPGRPSVHQECLPSPHARRSDSSAACGPEFAPCLMLIRPHGS